MKKHDELVEEIASLIKVVAIHRNHEVTQAAEGAAMAIITLTLSAVRDGLEIPGEVGRGKIQYAKGLEELDQFQEMWDGELVVWKAPHAFHREYEFIALSGTSQGELVGGKEEEVLETKNIPRYCEHCGSEEHYTSEH